MKDNWYILLELEFDPMVTDETVIEKRIEEKRKYWSSKYNDFRIGKQCKTWVAAVPQIKKDMIGPDNKRAQIAGEAKSIIYKPIDDMIFAVEDDGEINQSEVSRIVQKTGQPESTVLKRLSEHGISVISETAAMNLYERYYAHEYADDTKYKMTEQLLDAQGCSDLYDFLFPSISKSIIKGYDIVRLQQAASSKRKQYTGNDAVSSNGQKLCGYCVSAFADNKSRKNYDDYLLRKSIRAALDELKDIADISGKIKDKNINNTVKKISDSCGDSALSRNIVMAFVEAKGIELKNQSEADNKPVHKQQKTKEPDIPQTYDAENEGSKEKKPWISPDDSLPVKIVKVIVALIVGLIQGIIFIAPYVSGFLVILIIIGFFTGHSQELFGKIGSYLYDKLTILFDWVGRFFEK